LSEPKTKPYHHGDLRETLLALALEELEAVPPTPLTLRGLAEKAGVTAMAPYRHFADKEALLAAVAAKGFADLRGPMLAVDVAADAKTALIAFGVIYVSFAVERPGLFQLMYGGRPPTDLSEEDPNTAIALVGRRIAELVAPGEQETAFLAAWALVHGLATLLVSGRIRQNITDDPTELAERVGTLFVRALEIGETK
jgi:AcrR family transcriptional regulator